MWNRIHVLLTILLLAPATAGAHCDTMDGPVIVDARKALAAGDPAPALRWVTADREAEIRTAFRQTLAVRKEGGLAAELADRYFFETLVRLHRAGEGAPYTGLKPGGSTEPAIAAADRALQSGSVDALADRIAQAVRNGIRVRHTRAVALRKHRDESVRDGRDFVAAYVDYVHFIEGVHGVVSGKGGHHEEDAAPRRPSEPEEGEGR